MTASREPVAVVGAACRLPGGIGDLDGLWSALSAGCDLVTKVPGSRFEAARFFDSVAGRRGKTYTTAGGFLDDIVGFDAGYFSIAPREASRIDPQQRLMLEMAVEALDDGGIDPAALAGSDTAVFVGIMNGDYGVLQTRDLTSLNAYSMAGTTLGNAANRVSHFLDLRGPSMAIDTACSSALVAVHEACQALRSGECRVALAGGVNVLLDPSRFVGFAQASMLSARGRCQTFSANADGYVRAEGAGLVVLKSLSDAEADGDRVDAVLLATGVNFDGYTTGLSKPSAEAQQALLQDIQARARVDPDALVYWEAHGTGTAVGDPVECEAIGKAIGMRRSPGNTLPIGSIKTNLGHMEAAAGLAGLLKCLLVLRERAIPASLHSTPLSPAIDWATLRLAPVTSQRPTTTVRRAVVGVSSFGYGGVNAASILAEAPGPRRSRRHRGAPAQPGQDVPAAGALPLVASGRTEAAAVQAAIDLADRCDIATSAELYDISYTLCRRRRLHPHRIAVVAPTPGQAAAALRQAAEDQGSTGAGRDTARAHGGVAFVFPGMGAQWPGMGVELMATNAVFRDALHRIDRDMCRHAGWSVVDELSAPAERSRLNTAEVAQPALFAVQVGLVEVLGTYGIRPSWVLGHSVGEVAAAHVSGALDIDEAILLSVERSRAQQRAAGLGGMAAVGLGPAQIAEELAAYDGRLELAAINSEQDVTIAGDHHALEDLGERLARVDVFFRRLDVEFAYHSRTMDGVEAPLREALRGLRPGEPCIEFVSTVTGHPLEGERLDGEYWWRNVRQPVMFGPAAAQVVRRGCDIFMEIGPHPVLQTYLRRVRSDRGRIAVVPTLRREEGTESTVRTAVASLLAAGADVDWEALLPRAGRVVRLPTYPWQREPHWNGETDWWAPRHDHPLLGERAPVLEPTWQAPLDPARVPWLTDHRIHGAAVMPATGFIEMAMAAGRRILGNAVEVTALDLPRALELPSADEPTVQVQVSLSDEDGLFRVASRAGRQAEWQLHARGRVRACVADPPPGRDIAHMRQALASGTEIGPEDHYRRAAQAGLAFGPAFRPLRGIRVKADEALAEYQHDVLSVGYEAHPGLVDGALQTAAALLWSHSARVDGASLHLPVFVEQVRMWRRPPSTGFVRVLARNLGAREAVFDITLADAAGVVTMTLLGCRLRRIAASGPPACHVTVMRAAPRPGPAQGRAGGASSPLPSIAQVIGTAEPRLAQVRTSWRRMHRRHGRFMAAYLDLAAHFTVSAVQELVPNRGEWSIHTLVSAGVQPKYSRLVQTLCDIAVARGVCERRGEAPPRWRAVRPVAPPPLFEEMIGDFPDHAAELLLAGRCGTHLAEVLRGRRDALDLIFPQGGMQTAEHLYDSGSLRRHHPLAREITRAIVASWPSDRPLRILEVGAGTGGQTAALLPLLPPDRTQYVFTDISPAFFARAAARFQAYDFLEFRPLDLDRSPAEQGFSDSSFDIVVAAEVVHATRNLRDTIGHVTQLLDNGAYLLIGEQFDPWPWSLTFGLLDGWWCFEDAPLRKDSPLLSAGTWAGLLSECGLTEVVQVSAATEGASSDYALFMSRRPSASTSRQAGSHADHASVVEGCTGWVVAVEATDDTRLAVAVADALRLAGHVAVHALTAPTSPQEWSAVIPSGVSSVDIVYVLSGDHAIMDADPAASGQRIVAATATLQAAAGACHEVSAGAARVWVVSRPAGLFPRPERPLTPGDAALWGVARCLANENPDLTVRRVSLERGVDPADDAGRLTAELLDPSAEDEVVLTGGGRFVPRVVRGPLPRLVDAGCGGARVTLRLRDQGVGYRLGWEHALPVHPGPGQVTVDVRAIGLHYRNVLKTLGRSPAEDSSDEADAITGFDYAGVVTDVGEDVTDVRAGDRVYGLTVAAICSEVAVDRALMGHIPEGVEFAAAATIPMAFLTVRLGLAHTARIGTGETVLVHGAAGGVGLAALQHARHVGARVIGTAGSDEKRDLLRLLAVEHVLDSRSLRFAEEVQALTGGRGVDVVLNSLAGEALTRSIELLRPGGRFVELGKRDLHGDSRLAMRALRNNVSFSSVDLRQVIDTIPELAHAEFREVAALVSAGAYRPLPYRTYPAARVSEAFEHLQHSRHIGKVVVSFGTDQPVPVDGATIPLAVDPDGVYLVTGGLAGFGAAAARWLADHGARHLALTSRRGIENPEARGTVEALRERGAEVATYAADVTDPQATAAVVSAIGASGRRLAGVLHVAMVLDDGPLTDLTGARFHAALAPKQRGVAILDQLTRDHPLDMFVVFSSITATLGYPEQANYAAGNLFGEALVRARRARGRPGLAIAWGAIGDVGYVARNRAVEASLGRWVRPMDPTHALDIMGDLLRRDADVAIVGEVNWDGIGSLLPGVNTPRFSLVRPNRTRSARGAAALVEELRVVGDDEAQALLSSSLTGMLADILYTPTDRIDVHRPLTSLGIDSLMSAELSAAIWRSFGCDLPVMAVMSSTDIADLSTRLLARLRGDRVADPW